MTMPLDLESCRRFYAEELRAASRLESEALVEAFARVPRERFLGPGPWQIPIIDMLDPRGGNYYTTADADPRRVHHNIAVAIDPSRHLNNGHPGTLAAWIESLKIRPGNRVVHIGAGTGYYTSIMAELCGPHGSVFAVEADKDLAARAAHNLQPWPQVRIEHGDGLMLSGTADAIFVNAGVTYAPAVWLDALRGEGRLLLPVTASFGAIGKGVMIMVQRRGDAFQAGTATGGGFVAIFNCAVARDESTAPAIGKALTTGGFGRVRSLRRDTHGEDSTCILHRDGCCLSSETVAT